jgi:hypothetical protein
MMKHFLPLLLVTCVQAAENQLVLYGGAQRDRRPSIFEDPRHEVRRTSLTDERGVELERLDDSHSSIRSVIIHVAPHHNDPDLVNHLAHHVAAEERVQMERLRRRTRMAILTAAVTTVTAAASLIVNFTSKCN